MIGFGQFGPYVCPQNVRTGEAVAPARLSARQEPHFGPLFPFWLFYGFPGAPLCASAGSCGRVTVVGSGRATIVFLTSGRAPFVAKMGLFPNFREVFRDIFPQDWQIREG